MVDETRRTLLKAFAATLAANKFSIASLFLQGGDGNLPSSEAINYLSPNALIPSIKPSLYLQDDELSHFVELSQYGTETSMADLVSISDIDLDQVPDNVTLGSLLDKENVVLSQTAKVFNFLLDEHKEEFYRTGILTDEMIDYLITEKLCGISDGEYEDFKNFILTSESDWEEILDMYTDGGFDHLKTLTLREFYRGYVLPLAEKQAKIKMVMILDGWGYTSKDGFSSEQITRMIGEELIRELGSDDCGNVDLSSDLARRVLEDHSDICDRLQFRVSNYSILQGQDNGWCFDQSNITVTRIEGDNGKQKYSLSFGELVPSTLSIVEEWCGASLPFFEDHVVVELDEDSERACYIETSAKALQIMLDSKSVNRQRYGEAFIPQLA